jgi:hypothetical protein
MIETAMIVCNQAIKSDMGFRDSLDSLAWLSMWSLIEMSLFQFSSCKVGICTYSTYNKDTATGSTLTHTCRTGICTSYDT